MTFSPWNDGNDQHRGFYWPPELLEQAAQLPMTILATAIFSSQLGLEEKQDPGDPGDPRGSLRFVHALDAIKNKIESGLITEVEQIRWHEDDDYRPKFSLGFAPSIPDHTYKRLNSVDRLNALYGIRSLGQIGAYSPKELLSWMAKSTDMEWVKCDAKFPLLHIWWDHQTRGSKSTFRMMAMDCSTGIATHGDYSFLENFVRAMRLREGEGWSLSIPFRVATTDITGASKEEFVSAIRGEGDKRYPPQSVAIEGRFYGRNKKKRSITAISRMNWDGEISIDEEPVAYDERACPNEFELGAFVEEFSNQEMDDLTSKP